MASFPPLVPRRAAFDGLRAALAATHRNAALEAYTPAEDTIVRSRLTELDAALGGGFPRGLITTLEGPASSGRSAVAARLLATATENGGLGVLIELSGGPDGRLYPPGLAAAGVDLERLLIIESPDATSAARAADIVLRAAAFGVVVMPAVILRAVAWTRLASLTHRASTALITLGGEASNELGYFASVRIRLRSTKVRFAGGTGLFCALAEIDIEAAVLKHKRAVPGKRAHFCCTSFERTGAPLPPLRERLLAETAANVAQMH